MTVNRPYAVGAPLLVDARYALREEPSASPVPDGARQVDSPGRFSGVSCSVKRRVLKEAFHDQSDRLVAAIQSQPPQGPQEAPGTCAQIDARVLMLTREAVRGVADDLARQCDADAGLARAIVAEQCGTLIRALDPDELRRGFVQQTCAAASAVQWSIGEMSEDSIASAVPSRSPDSPRYGVNVDVRSDVVEQVLEEFRLRTALSPSAFRQAATQVAWHLVDLCPPVLQAFGLRRDAYAQEFAASTRRVAVLMIVRGLDSPARVNAALSRWACTANAGAAAADCGDRIALAPAGSAFLHRVAQRYARNFTPHRLGGLAGTLASVAADHAGLSGAQGAHHVAEASPPWPQPAADNSFASLLAGNFIQRVAVPSVLHAALHPQSGSRPNAPRHAGALPESARRFLSHPDAVRHDAGVHASLTLREAHGVVEPRDIGHAALSYLLGVRDGQISPSSYRVEGMVRGEIEAFFKLDALMSVANPAGMKPSRPADPPGSVPLAAADAIAPHLREQAARAALAAVLRSMFADSLTGPAHFAIPINLAFMPRALGQVLDALERLLREPQH